MAAIETLKNPNRLILEQANFLKLSFVRVLQEIFQDASIPEPYRYAPERQGGERGIGIFRANPNRTTMLPAIFVETEPATVSVQQLGDEIVAQVTSQETPTSPVVLEANIYGGVMFIPVKITIVAKTTTDRDVLTDIVSAYLRFAARPLFYANNVEYLDIRAGEDGEEGEGSSRVFKGTVQIKCQSEFRQEIDMSLYEKITSIDLGGLRYGVDDGVLEPIEGGS